MPVQTRETANHAFAAVRLAAWCNAVLGGAASLDEAAGAVSRGGIHRIAGLPGEDGLATLAVALGRLRAGGAEHATAALPVAGEAAGLAGPRVLTEVAVAAGHAVLVTGVRLPGAADATHLALVAQSTDGATVWESYEANAAPPALTEREAMRVLRETVLAAGDELTALDVAPFDPGSRDAMETELHSAEPGALPPYSTPNARRLHGDASRLWLAALVALGDEGGAISATAVQKRRDALRAVESASRQALMAVASIPPPRGG